MVWRYPHRLVADVLGVWTDTRLIVLTAQVAAVYAAILIPFKVGIPLIPGFVELRPANAIPIVTSLLFGPAAAWGAGIGNIIGDCFGTLGPASLFGFLGNFVLAYLPYRLWGHLGVLSSGQPPSMRSWRQGLEFGIICLIASTACAVLIAWGVEVLGLLPFAILAPAILINNVVMGGLLGPPLLMFLYPRVKRWGLLYDDLQAEAVGTHRRLREDNAPTPSHAGSVSTMAAPRPLVDMSHVTFTYRGATRQALRDVSLRMERGEWVVVMGRHGSGKSTLCLSVNGLVPHFLSGSFSGNVRVNGHDTRQRPVSAHARDVGVVFQDFDTQLVATHVEQEVVLPLEYMDPPLARDEMRARVRWALEAVELDHLRTRDTASLSGGQRQRLVLASALITRASVVVLDQPMTDMDPQARRRLRGLLSRLREQGTSLLVAEQDMEAIVDADRVCILESGALVWEGPPRALLSSPALAERHGLQPLPLAQCFSYVASPPLPVTVDEARQRVDELGLSFVVPASLRTARRRADGEQPRAEGHPFVQCRDLVFGYAEESAVLNGISCSIGEGAFVAVLGRNGSGKSTFGKLLGGLLAPRTGSVTIDGRTMQHVAPGERARVVGYVFQNPDHQIFAETVWDEVAFGLRNGGWTEEEAAPRIVDALTAAGLNPDDSRTADPFSLSKGERQRVAVASVVAANPSMIIFDEPTTGLDAEETVRMLRMLRQLNQRGHTIVMITHAMWLVAAYAKQCLVLHDGMVMADGTTADVFADRVTIETAGLEIPELTQFSQRFGETLFTVQAVQDSLTRESQ